MRELVVNGERLASAMEYLPGTGVYERSGELYAALCGHPRESRDGTEMTVKPATSVPIEFQPGDRVLGRIHMLKPKSAVVQVLKVKGRKRQVGTWEEGTLHISRMAQSYVENIRNIFQTNDLVQARVLKVGAQLELSTEDAQDGVVWSACDHCGGPLTRRERLLWCGECEREVHRKLSNEYDRLPV